MSEIGILTISDRAYDGQYADESGPAIAAFFDQNARWVIAKRAIVPDDQKLIADRLVSWSDANLQLILTTGGTGFAPRDVTPEATRAILDKEAPGIAEALRAASLAITQHAMLSRGVAGIRGNTLIINLPGSPKACVENLSVLEPVLPHALALLNPDQNADPGHRNV